MEAMASLLRGAWEWVQTLDPCSAAAQRERSRVRLQLEVEHAKPAGERNEKRLLALLKEDNRLYLAYYLHLRLRWIASADRCLDLSRRSDGCGCCGASAQVQGRAAASYRAVAAFYHGMETQTWEEMQALEEGRPAALKSLATLELQLPVEWVEHPPDRLDMCNACARLIEQLQSNEQYLRLKQIEVEKQHRERGLLPAASGSNGADSEAALAQQELQHGQAEPPGSPQQQQEGLPMQQRRPAGESPR